MGTDNPFKKISDNAKTTAKKYDSESTQSSVSAKTCPQCGAPRPINTNIAFCSYCRYHFMSMDVYIERKNE